MKVAIISAMPEELKPVLDQILIISEEKFGIPQKFILGKYKNLDLILCVGGIGKVNAAVSTTRLIEKYNPNVFIMIGVAGALNPDLKIGDIVIAKDAVYHDVNVTPLGYKLGEVPETGIIWEGDTLLVNKFFNICKNYLKDKKAITGRIASGDQFIASKEKAKEIRKVFNADAIEMETAAFYHTLNLYGKKGVVLRAVSDTADESANIDFPTFLNEVSQVFRDIIFDYLNTLENNNPNE